MSGRGIFQQKFNFISFGNKNRRDDLEPSKEIKSHIYLG